MSLQAPRLCAGLAVPVAASADRRPARTSLPVGVQARRATLHVCDPCCPPCPPREHLGSQETQGHCHAVSLCSAPRAARTPPRDGVLAAASRGAARSAHCAGPSVPGVPGGRHPATAPGLLGARAAGGTSTSTRSTRRSVRPLLHLALRSPRERVWMAPESRVRTGTFRDVQARCDVRARAEHEPLSRPVAAASGGRLALLPHDRRCRGRCHCRSFYVDVHTEAVQAALAKYKERKVPLPSKRRSALAHPSVETCTPPGTVAAPGGPTGRPAHRCHAVVSCRGGRSWPVGKIWKNRRGRRVSECGGLTRGPSPRLRCGLSCVHRGAVCVRLLVRGRP